MAGRPWLTDSLGTPTFMDRRLVRPVTPTRRETSPVDSESSFAGTRVPVDTLFEYLESGETLDEFLHQFPTVTRDQAVAVLEMSRQLARKEAMPA